MKTLNFSHRNRQAMIRLQSILFFSEAKDLVSDLNEFNKNRADDCGNSFKKLIKACHRLVEDAS